MVTQDEQGSVTALHDAAGSLVERVEYDPYGEWTVFPAGGGSQGHSSVGLDFSYTTYRHDQETGLLYGRNRYLHTDSGRWMSVDPLGPWFDPNDLGNFYTFVGHAPTTRRDALGLLGRDESTSEGDGPSSPDNDSAAAPTRFQKSGAEQLGSSLLVRADAVCTGLPAPTTNGSGNLAPQDPWYKQLFKHAVDFLSWVGPKVDWDCILWNKCKEPKPRPYIPPSLLDLVPDFGPDEKVRPGPPKPPGFPIPDDWSEWLVGRPFGMKPRIFIGLGTDPLPAFGGLTVRDYGINSIGFEFSIDFD
jgi:RHS repeat-associated protein